MQHQPSETWLKHATPRASRTHSTSTNSDNKKHKFVQPLRAQTSLKELCSPTYATTRSGARDRDSSHPWCTRATSTATQHRCPEQHHPESSRCLSRDLAPSSRRRKGGSSACQSISQLATQRGAQSLGDRDRRPLQRCVSLAHWFIKPTSISRGCPCRSSRSK